MSLDFEILDDEKNEFTIDVDLGTAL